MLIVIKIYNKLSLVSAIPCCFQTYIRPTVNWKKSWLVSRTYLCLTKTSGVKLGPLVTFRSQDDAIQNSWRDPPNVNFVGRSQWNRCDFIKLSNQIREIAAENICPGNSWMNEVFIKMKLIYVFCLYIYTFIYIYVYILNMYIWNIHKENICKNWLCACSETSSVPSLNLLHQNRLCACSLTGFASALNLPFHFE